MKFVNRRVSIWTQVCPTAESTVNILLTNIVHVGGHLPLSSLHFRLCWQSIARGYVASVTAGLHLSPCGDPIFLSYFDNSRSTTDVVTLRYGVPLPFTIQSWALEKVKEDARSIFTSKGGTKQDFPEHMRYVVTPHKVVCREGVTYENSRTAGRSVMGEIDLTGLLLLKGRGRQRNSGLDQYFWISLKRVPLLLKQIGLPLKLFKLLTKVNIGFKHSKFSQSSGLSSSCSTSAHPFGHSFSRCFLTCPASGLALCRAVSWDVRPLWTAHRNRPCHQV